MRLSALIVVASLAHPHVAFAQSAVDAEPSAPSIGAAPREPSQDPSAPLSVEEDWYGWQILIVDGGVLLATAAMIGAGVGTDSAAVPGIFGPSAHALGGPIVHWAHGHVGTGFASFGLRVGMPVVAGAIGMGIGHLAAPADSGAMFPLGVGLGAAVGGGLGYVGSIVVDSAVLAYEPSSPRAARTPAPATWQPIVSFDPLRDTVQLGAAGRF